MNNEEVVIKKAVKPDEIKEETKPVKKKITKKNKKVIKKKNENLSALEKLRPAHREFVAEYVKNLGNGTRAYMHAYPKSREATARVKASVLLTKDNIKESLKEEYAKYFAKKDSEIEKSKTYQMIHNLGDIPISDIIDLENGKFTIKDLKDIPPQAVHMIKTITRNERTNKDGGKDVNLQITTYDKLKALELRAKMQGLLKDDDSNKVVEIVVKPAVRPDQEDNEDEG